MKAVLLMLAVLVASVTVSADTLDFNNSSIWKKKVTSIPTSYHVEKQKTRIYIDDMVKDELDVMYGKFICRGRTVNKLAFDVKSGVTWVATDSGLVRQSATDTAYYLVKAGRYSNSNVKSVQYDADSNRIVAGTDSGVSMSKLDANGKPTTWANFLNVGIHQIVCSKGQIWMLNSVKVYHLVGQKWDTASQFGTPVSGDVDVDGNFWLSFGRTIGSTTDHGLAKFNGTTWSEHLVISADILDASARSFGEIRIDKSNTLWFSEIGYLGKVNLSTMSVFIVPGGTNSWAPKDKQVAISTTDEDNVIFAGSYVWIEMISNTAVHNPVTRVISSIAKEYKIVGTIDPLGRRISTSFSNVRSAAGLRFVMVQTPQGGFVRKILSSR